MKKKRFLPLILALLLLLGACGRDTTIPQGTGPGRMVRRIEVAIHPEDASLSRVYTTTENMNDLLSLLRAMSGKDQPAQDPDLGSGQSYYTATVTFANGEKTVYYLLGHTYLRRGNDPWCLVDSELCIRFVEFLRTRPSDDGTAPTQ